MCNLMHTKQKCPRQFIAVFQVDLESDLTPVRVNKEILLWALY